MTVNYTYRLCLGVFKQATGQNARKTYGQLSGEYNTIGWDFSTSIINFTNFQVGDTTVETIEKNTITALSKNKEYESGAVTPPTLTFANMTSADESNIIATLDKLTGVDDPFKVLFVAGVFNGDPSAAGAVRTYDVFNAAAAIVTSDGGRSGEAKAKFTGSLVLQACHIPLIGVTACNASLTWDTAKNTVTMTVKDSGVVGA